MSKIRGDFIHKKKLNIIEARQAQLSFGGSLNNLINLKFGRSFQTIRSIKIIITKNVLQS